MFGFKMAMPGNTFSVRMDGKENDPTIVELLTRKLGRPVQEVDGVVFIPFDEDGHEWHAQPNKAGVVHWSKGWGSETQAYAQLVLKDHNGDKVENFGATECSWEIADDGIILGIPHHRNPPRRRKNKYAPGTTTEDRAIECLQELAAYYNGPGLSISADMYDLLGRTLLDLMVEYGADDGDDNAE